MTLATELMLLWGALIVYVIAGALAIVTTLFRHRQDDLFQALLWLGLALHAVAIGYRWLRLGHGPFLTMFEILSSNIWSISLIFALVYWRLPAIRPAAALVVPVQFIMMAWLLLASPGASVFPPTYDTLWLYVHVSFGKVFMGAVVIAVALTLVVMLRQFWQKAAGYFSALPETNALLELAFRFLAVGLIFQSLMLVAGAIWAQDAWGRFWDWDPLETWSFIAWIATVLALHARVTWRLKPLFACILIQIVFIISFLTFFGVPFVSMVPHQGAV